MTAPLTPLKKGLARFDFTKKAWSKMLETGIVTPAIRLDGDKQYWLTADQMRRLEHIARTRDRLRNKYTLSAAAFELAADGFPDVPLDLTKAHVRRKAELAQGWLKRMFQRHLGLSSKPYRVTEEQIRRASIKLAKTLMRNAPKKTKSFQFLLVYSTIVLNLMYRPDAKHDYAGSLEDIMKQYFQFHLPGKGRIGMSDRVIRNNAEKLAGMLVDIRGGLRLDDRNTVFAVLKEISEEDFWKVFYAWPKFSKLIWGAHRGLRVVLPLPDPSPDERSEFEIIMFATLIANYDPRNPSPVFRQLLRGSTVTAGHLFDKIVNGIQMIVRGQRLIEAYLHK